MEPPQPTLLLVDDEQAILSALRRSLRSEGYRILTTSNPHEALSILEAERVDVLVSDVNMPEMNGLQLVAKARAAFPAVVRVLLTGEQSLDVVLEAINRGEVFRFLSKPWEQSHLRDAIRAAARHADGQRRAAAIDAAVTRRKRAVGEIMRREPDLHRAARTSDGAYVLEVAEERLRALSSLGVERGDETLTLLGRLLNGEISGRGAAVQELGSTAHIALGDTVTAPPLAIRSPAVAVDTASPAQTALSGAAEAPPPVPTTPSADVDTPPPVHTMPSADVDTPSPRSPTGPSAPADALPRNSRPARIDRLTRRPYLGSAGRHERVSARPRISGNPQPAVAATLETPRGDVSEALRKDAPAAPPAAPEAGREKLWRSTKPQGSPSAGGIVVAEGSTAVRVLEPDERVSSPEPARPLESERATPGSRAWLWAVIALVIVLALLVGIALVGR